MKIRVTSVFKLEGAPDVAKEAEALLGSMTRRESTAPEFSEADVTAVIAQHLVSASVVVSASGWQDAESRATTFIDDSITSIGGIVVRSATGSNDSQPRLHAPVHAGISARIQSTELVPA